MFYQTKFQWKRFIYNSEESHLCLVLNIVECNAVIVKSKNSIS